MTKSKYMKQIYSERVKDIDKLNGESDDLYELKCLNRTDVNMINARKWFDRPAYHMKFVKGEQNAESVEKG